MKTLADNERALIAAVAKTFGEQAGAQVECALSGNIPRFANLKFKTMQEIRALATEHGVELLC